MASKIKTQTDHITRNWNLKTKFQINKYFYLKNLKVWILPVHYCKTYKFMWTFLRFEVGVILYGSIFECVSVIRDTPTQARNIFRKLSNWQDLGIDARPGVSKCEVLLPNTKYPNEIASEITLSKFSFLNLNLVLCVLFSSRIPWKSTFTEKHHAELFINEIISIEGIAYDQIDKILFVITDVFLIILM